MTDEQNIAQLLRQWAEVISLPSGQFVKEDLTYAADTITRLTEERDALADDRDGYVQLLTDQNTRLTAGVEGLKRQIAEWVDAGGDAHSVIRRQMEDRAKLRAALRECEAELNAYYRMKYRGDHPHSQKELAQAMASNPATVALQETNND
jgi:chromosome segregation ATPase